MPPVNVNADNRLYVLLIGLKRHLAQCPECKISSRTSDAEQMCGVGVRFVIEAAKQYNAIIPLRIKARNSTDHTVFPCPKPSAHGKTYELTALPVVVIGTQDRLI